MENWGRIPSTSFDAETGKLSWSVHDNTDPLLTFAYFPTYSLERQERLVHSAALSGHCQHKVLGETVDKRPLHALLFNKHVKAENPKTIWVQHRQHPGEVSASWFCDGVVERLCAMSRSSPPSRLLQNAIVLVVPNVNPDGGVRGHLRTNAVGANLNRCWGRLHGIDECAGQTVSVRAGAEKISGAYAYRMTARARASDASEKGCSSAAGAGKRWGWRGRAMRLEQASDGAGGVARERELFCGGSGQAMGLEGSREEGAFLGRSSKGALLRRERANDRLKGAREKWRSSAAGAGERTWGLRGETPRTPPAAGL
jgi:hypothetical protein